MSGILQFKIAPNNDGECKDIGHSDNVFQFELCSWCRVPKVMKANKTS